MSSLLLSNNFLHVQGILLIIQISIGTINSQDTTRYGVDVSWPVHTLNVSTNYPTPNQNHNAMDSIQPLGDRQAFYDNFMSGCVETWSNFEECHDCEVGRIYSNLIRMQYMKVSEQINYTILKTNLFLTAYHCRISQKSDLIRLNYLRKYFSHCPNSSKRISIRKYKKRRK